MPRKDSIHDAVKNALVKDGWTILDDPYSIRYEDVVVFADLRVERETEGKAVKRTLVLEIKAFTRRSAVLDLEQALGQYQLYRSYLRRVAPDEELYLAIDDTVYNEQFMRAGFRAIIEDYAIALLVVDVQREEIVQWKN